MELDTAAWDVVVRRVVSLWKCGGVKCGSNTIGMDWVLGGGGGDGVEA